MKVTPRYTLFTLFILYETALHCLKVSMYKYCLYVLFTLEWAIPLILSWLLEHLRCFKLFLISALSAISHHSEWVWNADIGRCSYRLNLGSCPTTRSSLRLVSVLLGHNPPAQMKCWYRVIRLKVALTFADMDSSFKSISINRAFNLYNAVTTILWITDSVSCINYFFFIFWWDIFELSKNFGPFGLFFHHY